ncbi:hypothetical protein [Marinobacterium sp. xm-v-233]|uniref:hypothetical protein n=1 Tax=Marinobacterium sp. xm-v-233 TaxID=2497744 RepID=UPI001567D2EF|nr:hypothetical protein [Marinobacterium sp. xm-v-233]NRQ00798.1 hypothetical protein [Marinobacterium sp. xm-v-233]
MEPRIVVTPVKVEKGPNLETADPRTVVVVPENKKNSNLGIHLWKYCYKDYKRQSYSNKGFTKNFTISESSESHYGLKMVKAILVNQNKISYYQLRILKVALDKYVLPEFELSDLFEVESAKIIYIKSTKKLFETAYDKYIHNTKKNSYLAERSIQLALAALISTTTKEPIENISNWATKVIKENLEKESIINSSKENKRLTKLIYKDLSDEIEISEADEIVITKNNIKNYRPIFLWKHCWNTYENCLGATYSLSEENRNKYGTEMVKAIISNKDIFSWYDLHNLNPFLTKYFFTKYDYADLFDEKIAKEFFIKLIKRLETEYYLKIENKKSKDSSLADLRRKTNIAEKLLCSTTGNSINDIRNWAYKTNKVTDIKKPLIYNFNRKHIEEIKLERVDWEEEIIIANPKTIVAERINQGKSTGIHLWKYCYERYKRINDNTYEIDTQSFNKYGMMMVESIIERNKLFLFADLKYINSMLKNYVLTDFNLRDLFNEETAIKIYYSASMRMIDDANDQTIGSTKPSRSTLSYFQKVLSLILHCTTKKTLDIIDSWGPAVSRASKYSTNIIGKRSGYSAPNQDEASIFVRLSQRHFNAIAESMEKELPYYYVEQKDLGFENIVRYTNVSSIDVENLIEKHPFLSSLFDDKLIYIGPKDEDERKEIRKSLLGADKHTYDGTIKRFNKFSKKKETDYRNHLYMKHLSIHFASLLMFETGCNREQIAYINFDDTLISGTAAQRILATKPRAGYSEKPIWISAEFIPTWRRYRDIRKKYLQKYSEEYSPYGIKIQVSSKSFGQTFREMQAVEYTRSKINGFPETVDIRSSFAGRKYTTIDFLNQTSGNTALVSSIIGRADATTQRHYLAAAQVDSAISITEFFNKLEQFVSYKTQNTNTDANIIEGGDSIPTGHCDATLEEQPEIIDEVTEVVQNPRCGAPISCLFCKHFGIHATKEDIHIVLSAKKWLSYQREYICSSIDENFLKFSPFEERIDDIIADFRSRGESYESVYSDALKEIDRGVLSPYWGDKIEAILEMEGL